MNLNFSVICKHKSAVQTSRGTTTGLITVQEARATQKNESHIPTFVDVPSGHVSRGKFAPEPLPHDHTKGKYDFHYLKMQVQIVHASAPRGMHESDNLHLHKPFFSITYFLYYRCLKPSFVVSVLSAAENSAAKIMALRNHESLIALINK